MVNDYISRQDAIKIISEEYPEPRYPSWYIDKLKELPAKKEHNKTMDFGEAIREAKKGKLIARFGWNGRGMAIAYRSGYPAGILANKSMAAEWDVHEGTIVRIQPYLQLRCVDGTYQMWVASQTDILAEDWYIVK